MRVAPGVPVLRVLEPVLSDPSRPAQHAVEIFGGRFIAFDVGSVIVDDDGTPHDDQCVLVTLSVIDLVSSGTALTNDVVTQRSTALARAFTHQAREVVDELGSAASRLSLAEAELREDARNILDFDDHDTRCAARSRAAAGARVFVAAMAQLPLGGGRLPWTVCV